MQTEKIALDETDCFSSFFLDYISEKEQLKPFYNQQPLVDNFKSLIENRAFDSSARNILVDTLTKQYAKLNANGKVTANIQALRSDKTFTITTGHQLNIFTGPMYFVYKIVTAINVAKTLKEKYPTYDFVPVYWMASEDHDFEEINHFHLHGKKHTWESKQSGAVGRFDPSELKELLTQLPGDVSVFEKAYLENSSLADACRQYVHELFGHFGLVVIDADDAGVKTLLKPAMTADLFDHSPQKLVDQQTAQLEGLGYKTHVHAREINFFYLEDGLRSRIERVGDRFRVVDTDISFSESELKELVNTHPEKLSPNVVLRPLYQEMILPNLAYIGGPSELVYWLQLKPVFDHFKVAFPALMPRNFGVLLSSNAQRLKEKAGLSSADIFKPLAVLEKEWTSTHSGKDLSLSSSLDKIKAQYEAIKNQAGAVDPTLVAHIEALGTQASKRIEIAEKKMVRAEKRLHADALNQISQLRESVFPGGALQERKENFMGFSEDHSAFIDELVTQFDPFDFRMHIMSL